LYQGFAARTGAAVAIVADMMFSLPHQRLRIGSAVFAVRAIPKHTAKIDRRA
jgi:hypothetical protein